MNNLTVFSKDVIPVYLTDEGKKVVNGRELYEGLEMDTDYPKWFDRMAEYGFVAGEDYTEFWEKGSESFFDFAQFKSPQQATALGYRKNHLLTLDMAKHIAMIQRSPEGKLIRDKLIQLETNVSELSPELRLLINMEVQQKQQAKMIEDTNERLDRIGDLVALDSTAWRVDTRNLIVKIAHKLGGNEYMREVQTEIYKLLEKRGSFNLEARLTNKRRRMMEEGACKSKIDKLNKVDIIAEDKKAIEIYVAIVKEMAVKYGVWDKDRPDHE